MIFPFIRDAANLLKVDSHAGDSNDKVVAMVVGVVQPAMSWILSGFVGKAGDIKFLSQGDVIISSQDISFLCPLLSICWLLSNFNPIWNEIMSRIWCCNWRSLHVWILEIDQQCWLCNIEKLHCNVHSMNGILGLLYCSHTKWKNCLNAWAGSYQGKENSPSVALKGIADYHMFFGTHCMVTPRHSMIK